MFRSSLLTILALVAIVPSFTGCGQGGNVATETSEVVVFDDEPEILIDPFDKEFLVDGERALRIVPGIAPPRLLSRGPRVTYPSSERSLCFPAATIIVVVDKEGVVRETEIVSVSPAIEYLDSGRTVLSAAESKALIEEREFAIRNWTFEPAMKDGEPVPSLINGGWRMSCR